MRKSLSILLMLQTGAVLGGCGQQTEDAGGGQEMCDCTLEFLEPAENASFVRGTVDGRDWAAPVRLAVSARGVQSVEFFDDVEPLGTVHGEPWEIRALLLRDGKHGLQAVGRDALGRELIRVGRTITIKPSEDSGCMAALAALGADFTPARPTKGVTEPVILQPSIEGVTFRSWKSAKPHAFLAACEMGKRLVEFARLVKRHNVDEVLHMGVYNYRKMRNPECIKRKNCRLSQHAYATAIDVYGVGIAGSDASYSFKHDWVVDKSVGVCPGNPKGEGDRLLHAISCGAFARRIFNVILTPNYNLRHSDHTHSDLTMSWHGLRGEDLGIDPEIEGVDPEINGLGD